MSSRRCRCPGAKKAPSLYRRYPASLVVGAFPPSRQARPRPHGLSVDPACAISLGGTSRVATGLSRQTCRHQCPGEPVRCFFLASRTMSAFPVLKPGRRSHYMVSGLAQCSFALRPASLADSLFRSLLRQGLRALRYLCTRLDCYRRERKLPGGFSVFSDSPTRVLRLSHGALQQPASLLSRVSSCSCAYPSRGSAA